MIPLISPKPFEEFGAEEYYAYVQSMYGVRVKRGAKPPSPAPGLSVSRTKKGALSVRRTPKARAFDYVTMHEVELLAKAADVSQAELWNCFKRRGFIVARDRLEAERTYAVNKGEQRGEKSSGRR